MASAAYKRGVHGRVQDGINKFLDVVDVSMNIRRILYTIRGSGNDVILATASAVVSWLLAAVWLSFAYYYDFLSTYKVMEIIVTPITQSLPPMFQSASLWLMVAATLTPAAVEMFQTAFAREGESIVPIFRYTLVTMVLFDLVTDIPAAIEFTQLMASGTNFLIYWATFLGWLFMATVGFEVMFVLTAFIALFYTAKAVGFYQGNYKPQAQQQQAPRNHQQQPKNNQQHNKSYADYSQYQNSNNSGNHTQDPMF